MREHFRNAVYGVLDYASFPFGMLLVAPIVLHRLGAAEYGLWMIATAVISAGGIIASGFCDANIQRIARLRGTGETDVMVHTVRSIFGINLVLGIVIATAAWLACPFAAKHVAVSESIPLKECLASLRIGSVLILARAIETVSVSTQRAFEQYRGTVQISTTMRLLTLAAAGILALMGHRTESILIATGVFLALGAYMQFRQLRRFFGPVSLWPEFHPEATRSLLRVGFPVWIQALGGVIFGQFDRILLGVSLGAVAVAPYSLCVQFAQPIAGITGSGLHFLFPYFSRRAGTVSTTALSRTVWKAFLCNLALVIAGSALLLLFGKPLLRIWAGAAVAHSAAGILLPIVLGSALLGLSVTGIYAAQALSLFRIVACINLGGRAIMLLVMINLLRHHGLTGLADSRLFYGAIALLVYVPLLHRLTGRGSKAAQASSTPSIPRELQEES